MSPEMLPLKFLWMLLSVLAGGALWMFFDKVYFKNIDFVEELKKGNLAVGVLLGGVALGVCILCAYIWS